MVKGGSVKARVNAERRRAATPLSVRQPVPVPEETEELIEFAMHLIGMLQRPGYIKMSIREWWSRNYPKAPECSVMQSRRVFDIARRKYCGLINMDPKEMREQIANVMGEIAAATTINKPDVAIKAFELILKLFGLDRSMAPASDTAISPEQVREMFAKMDGVHHKATPEQAKMPPEVRAAKEKKS